jgi:hypothetical protein
MRRVTVRQLVPGQSLAAPVTAAGGVVLVQTGTQLTESTIARLIDRGIESVLVQEDDAADPERIAAEAAAIEARFTGHDGNAWMMALKQILLAQLAPPAAGTPDA